MIAANATPLALDRDKIPALLKNIPRWVVWQAGQTKLNGKFDKVPVNPVTGRNINGNDPANWLTYSAALACYEGGKGSGIGLALCDQPVATWGNVLCGAHQYLVALDFDHCSNNLQEVKAVKRDLGAIYGEVSPSGKGIRMFALSRKPPKGGNAGDGREMYASGRFITVTGQVGHGEVLDATEKITALECQWFPAKGTKALPTGLEGAVRASADAMTLSLAGTPPETPEAIARVQAQLAHLDADCDYERWRNVVWSVVSTDWECAEDKAREWSRTANTRYNEDTFCQLVKSFDPSRGITLGTLDHLAREGGWSPAAAAPRASQANQALDQHNKTTRLLTASQLKALPLMAWRIRGLLPMRGLASMYGSSGSGKTFLALDVACAIATGQPQWFGAKITAAPVAYVALEGEAGIRQRVTAWEQHHGQQVTERLRFVLGNYTLMDPQDSAFLANEIIESLGTGAVVFIDTLNQAAPGADENTSADMGRIITNAKALATAVDGIVVLVHHAGKDATRGMRGHSSLFAAMDAVIEVKNTVNGRTWNLAKSKDSVSGVALGFELVHHIVGDDEDGLNISSCAVSPMLPLSPTRKPVGGKNQIAALAALSRMAADHSNGVPTKLAHQAVATTLDGPANRKSTKAKQLIQAMTESGHLRQENEGVFVN